MLLLIGRSHVASQRHVQRHGQRHVLVLVEQLDGQRHVLVLVEQLDGLSQDRHPPGAGSAKTVALSREAKAA